MVKEQLKTLIDMLPHKTADAPYSLAGSNSDYLKGFDGVVVAVGLSLTKFKNEIDCRHVPFLNNGSNRNIIKIINKEGMNLFLSIITATDLIEAVEFRVYSKDPDSHNIVLPDLLSESKIPCISKQLKSHGMWLNDPMGYDPSTMTHYYDNGLKKLTSVEGMTFSDLTRCLNTSGLAATVCAELGVLPIAPHSLEDVLMHGYDVEATDCNNKKSINLPNHKNVISWLSYSSDPFVDSGKDNLTLIID